MHYAAKSNRRECVRYIHELGVDMSSQNNDQETPLWVAINAGNLISLQALSELGEDINQRDVNGKAPIHKAIENNDANTLRTLIDLGADLNTTWRTTINGENIDLTPLQIAAIHNHYNIFSILLDSHHLPKSLAGSLLVKYRALIEKEIPINSGLLNSGLLEFASLTNFAKN